VPFEFEQFSKLDHFIIADRWIIVRCKADLCRNQRVLDLRIFDPELTVVDLEKKTYRCTMCGSRKTELIVEMEREWRKRIKRGR
jgi:hypothetical protein